MTQSNSSGVHWASSFTQSAGFSAILVFVVLFFASHVPAAEFELEGIMVRQPIGSRTNVVKPLISHLKLSVQDCKWLIREQLPNEAPDYSEMGADGTNIYRLIMMRRSTQGSGAPMAVQSKKVAPINSASGAIFPGAFPHFEPPPHKAILYLAYASGCYLDTVRNEMLPTIPIAPPDQFTPALQLNRAAWERYSDSFRLVRELAYFAPPYGNRTSQPYPYTNGYLSVSKPILTNGVQIPLEFKYFYMERFRDNKGNDLYPSSIILSEYSFRATNVRSRVSVGSFVPETPSNMLVTDHRFVLNSNPIPPISLNAIRGSWPSSDETIATAEYQGLARIDWKLVRANSFREATRLQQERPQLARFLFVLFFAIVAGGFWLIRRNLKTNQTQNK